VKQAAARANAELRQRASELAFEFEDDIAKVVVKLIDKGTGEVIRQFPSEEMLRIARALSKEQHVGALLRADA
jgi:flagellar protein FlaG